MMPLKIQIYSLIYSFLFGCFFYYLLKLYFKIKFKKHFIMKLIVSLFFANLLSILYFFGLLHINNGYLHLYFLLMIIAGYGLMCYFKR